jgi:hypothetical protein
VIYVFWSLTILDFYEKIVLLLGCAVVLFSSLILPISE